MNQIFFCRINSPMKALALNQSTVSICLLFWQFTDSINLITFSINHCCVMRPKEFSSRTENSKIESFSWNKFSSDTSCFELEQYFTFLLFFPFRGVLYRRYGISHCCFSSSGGCTENI